MPICATESRHRITVTFSGGQADAVTDITAHCITTQGAGMDLLIKNARVQDDRDLVDIAISDGHITELKPDLTGTATEQIDAAGRAVLPGFVEPHLHMDKALLYRREPTRDGTLEEAIRLTGKLKAEQDREDVLERSCAAKSLPSPPGSRSPPANNASTCQPTGPGKTPGPRYSPERSAHQPQPLPDHPAQPTQPEPTVDDADKRDQPLNHTHQPSTTA